MWSGLWLLWVAGPNWRVRLLQQRRKWQRKWRKARAKARGMRRRRKEKGWDREGKEEERWDLERRRRKRRMKRTRRFSRCCLANFYLDSHLVFCSYSSRTWLWVRTIYKIYVNSSYPFQSPCKMYVITFLSCTLLTTYLELRNVPQKMPLSSSTCHVDGLLICQSNHCHLPPKLNPPITQLILMVISMSIQLTNILPWYLPGTTFLGWQRTHSFPFCQTTIISWLTATFHGCQTPLQDVGYFIHFLYFTNMFHRKHSTARPKGWEKLTKKVGMPKKRWIMCIVKKQYFLVERNYYVCRRYLLPKTEEWITPQNSLVDFTAVTSPIYRARSYKGGFANAQHAGLCCDVMMWSIHKCKHS